MKAPTRVILLRVPLFSLDEVAEMHASPYVDFFRQPEVQNAILVTGTHFPLEPPAGKEARWRLSAARYSIRMTRRATPFGLFAGVARLSPGDATDVRASFTQIDAKARLHFGLLLRFVERLLSDEAVRHRLAYWPNPTLYQFQGRYRFAESGTSDDAGEFGALVDLESSAALSAVFRAAARGLLHGDIVGTLAALGHSRESATSYVDELVSGGILISELHPPVSGGDPLDHVLRGIQLRGLLSHPLASVLFEMQDSLDDLSRDPVRAFAHLRELASRSVGATDARALVYVEPRCRLERAVLGTDIIDECERFLRFVVRLDALGTQSERVEFRRMFEQRFDDRQVPIPLLEILDACYEATADGADAFLLRGLPAPPPRLSGEVPDAASVDIVQRRIERLAGDALFRGEREVELRDVDFADLLPAAESSIPLIGGAVLGRLVAQTGDGATRDLRLELGGWTSHPLVFIARHGVAHPDIAELVERLASDEERSWSDCLLADLAYAPSPNLANVSVRPAAYGHEIVFQGCSGLERDRQIQLTDLYVSRDDAGFHLLSREHRKEVLIRLSGPFNLENSDVHPYVRMLHAVFAGRFRGSPPPTEAPFVPRIRYGRVVVRPARWRIDRRTVDSMPGLTGSDGAKIARAMLGLPRWVAIADGDNVLPLDLDTDHAAILTEELQRLGRKEPGAVLIVREWEDGAWVESERGRHIGEVVVTVPGDDPKGARRLSPEAVGALFDVSVPPEPFRRKAPGSDALYLCLDCPVTRVDEIVLSTIAPLVHNARERGQLAKWFFVPFHDGRTAKLRLRLWGPDRSGTLDLLPKVTEALASTLGERLRVSVEVYEREWERYGGEAGTLLAEELFSIDSDTCVELYAWRASVLPERIWLAAFASTHDYLETFALAPEERHAFAESRAQDYAKEFGATPQFHVWVGKRWRDVRSDVDSLIGAPGCALADDLAALRPIFERRRERLLPLVHRLDRTRRDGILTRTVRSLLTSYLHMNACRLLHGDPRRQELVMWHWLARAYLSPLARQRRESRGHGKRG